jgi:peptidoglycan/xylan/chitin deacetylase (PgdA/CDA1 family)
MAAAMQTGDVKSYPRIPILMYHSIPSLGIEKGSARKTNPAYRLPVDKFRSQMMYLAEHNFEPLTVDGLVNGREVGDEKGIVITFDDGWYDNYVNAFPILQEIGISATIFVATGLVGQNEYLGWRELKQMSSWGVSIQSHTVSHKPLTELRVSDLEKELDASKKTLEDRLKTEINHLSAPHGMINKRVIAAARDVGYTSICTSEPGFKHRCSEPAILKRFNVPSGLSLPQFGGILRRAPLPVFKIALGKKVRNMVKGGVGWEFYRMLYRLYYGTER